MIDTHAHLDADEFDPDRADVLVRARRAGVEAILCPGITADSSQAAVRLAESHPDVYAAVGIQPNYAAQAAPGDWERIERLAERPRVVAIGETGLDRYWDFTPFDVQQDYFGRHLRLARDRGLPVVIHCRRAEREMIPRLGAWSAGLKGSRVGVIHCFSGDEKLARGALAQLRLLQRQESRHGATIMVTHDEALAQEFANVVIRMAPRKDRPAGEVVEVIRPPRAEPAQAPCSQGADTEQ